MRHALAAVVLGTLTVAPLVSPAAPAGEAQLEQLSWISGCWATEKGEPGSVEHWLPLAGGTMLGMARTVKGGRTVQFEFMQIRLNEAGKVVFIALPSGQDRTTFTATTFGDRSITFEQPAHDFPQKVTYRAVGDDRLAASIEGPIKGKTRTIDFPMKRVACEPAPEPTR